MPLRVIDYDDGSDDLLSYAVFCCRKLSWRAWARARNVLIFQARLRACCFHTPVLPVLFSLAMQPEGRMAMTTL